MLQKLRANNTQGFTLIELMIVIAIIGILAAIAIPNFINYRDKSFCSAAESDANSIANRLSDYFSIPSRTDMPDINAMWGDTLSGDNSIAQDPAASGDPTGTIVLTVTDGSGRCPEEYRNAMTAADNPKGYWSGNDYVKVLD